MTWKCNLPVTIPTNATTNTPIGSVKIQPFAMTQVGGSPSAVAWSTSAGGAAWTGDCVAATTATPGRYSFSKAVYLSGAAYSASRTYQNPELDLTIGTFVVSMWSNNTCNSTALSTVIYGTLGQEGAWYVASGWPSEYFVGGTAGTAKAVACWTATPSTTSSAPAEFTLDASCTTNRAGATYAWSESSASVTLDESTGRIITASVSATGAFDVSLTVTKDGVTSTYVGQLLVGVSEDGGADSDDCPTGWALLNPAALFELLECLFIPSEDLSASWDDLETAAETSYPFGPVLWVGGSLNDAYTGLTDGLEDDVADTDGCGLGIQELDHDDNPSTPPLPVPRPGVPYSGEDCPEEDRPDFVVTAQTVSRSLSTLLIVIGFIYWLKRKGESLMGPSDGA